jgi:hypothetical protein
VVTAAIPSTLPSESVVRPAASREVSIRPPQPPLEDSVAPIGIAHTALFDLGREIDALAVTLIPLFPCDEASQEEFWVPPERTWTAVVFVDTMTRFAPHLTGPLVDRVRRFAAMHAVAQAKTIETAYLIVRDEEAALEERRTAAARLSKTLFYVQELVSFYAQRSTHPDYQVVSTSELMGEVFAGQLQVLRDGWLRPRGGKLSQYLASLRNSAADSELSFLRVGGKANIAECLSPLDDLLRPHDTVEREGWVGFTALSAELSLIATALAAADASTNPASGAPSCSVGAAEEQSLTVPSEESHAAGAGEVVTTTEEERAARGSTPPIEAGESADEDNNPVYSAGAHDNIVLPAATEGESAFLAHILSLCLVLWRGLGEPAIFSTFECLLFDSRIAHACLGRICCCRVVARARNPTCCSTDLNRKGKGLRVCHAAVLFHQGYHRAECLARRHLESREGWRPVAPTATSQRHHAGRPTV